VTVRHGYHHLIVLGRGTIAPWLLSIFLALGPVYWLPGVSMEVLRPIEWSIFLVALILVLGPELLQGRLFFPSGLLGPLGFAGILFLWVPGLVQASDSFFVITHIIQTGFCGTFFWCFFCLAREGGNVTVIFQRAFILIGVLAGIALVRSLAGTVDLDSPCNWDSPYTNGFSIRSTAWSVGLGMFVPVALLFFLPSQNRQHWVWELVGIGGVIVLLFSQFVSGGRLGLLVSFLLLVAFVLLRSSWRLVVAVVLVGLLASTVYLDESCARHLKLNRFVEFEPLQHLQQERLQPLLQDGYKRPDLDITHLSALAKTPLDHISSRRIQGYWLGLEKVKERPFLGHGLQQTMLDTPWGGQTVIHNLWLRWAVCTGIFAPLLLLIMVVVILRAGWRHFRDKSKTPAERKMFTTLGLILLSGLLISMFEGAIFIGAFQVSAIWWAAAGTLVGYRGRSLSPLPEPLAKVDWARSGRQPNA